MGDVGSRDSGRRFGLGHGEVYPASESEALLRPARVLLHPPARLVRRLDPKTDDRILELGPGPGWFTRALATHVPAGRLDLVEVQPEMLAQACERAGSDVVVATVGDACDLPFPDAVFDGAVACAVLGETGSPPKALRELGRVLRPGGRLLVLETRTDPDFVPVRQLAEMAVDADLWLERRYGRILGYTAVLRRSGQASRR